MINKLLNFLINHTAKFVFAHAVSAAGAASMWGMYQEAEPKALAKLIQNRQN